MSISPPKFMMIVQAFVFVFISVSITIAMLVLSEHSNNVQNENPTTISETHME